MTSPIQSRRSALVTVGAALVAPMLIGSALAADTSAEAAKVAEAVEALRVAMLAGDGKTLKTLVFEELNYGHSDAHLDTKASFVTSLDGKNAFKSLEFSNRTVDIVGDNAIVRHVFDGVNNLPDGKTSTAHIAVLQVWKKDGGAWKLLARQSCPLPKA